MRCRRDLDVVGTALSQEIERHASPVCVGTGVRTRFAVVCLAVKEGKAKTTHAIHFTYGGLKYE